MTSGRLTAGWAWRVYVVASIVPLALYRWLPPVPQAVVFDALGMCAGLAVLAGVRINRPARPLPWILLALAQFAWAAGDVIWDLLSLGMGVAPFPSVADVAYLAGYPLAAAGVLLLARRPRGPLDWRTAVDSAIVVFAIGSISWTALVSPVVERGAETSLAFAVSLVYPLGDLLLIAALVPLVTVPARVPRAAWLLGASLGVSIVADILFALVGSEAPELNLLDLAYMVGYTLWAAAALHPSMVEIPGPDVVPERRLTATRIVGLLAALSVPVIAFAIDLVTGHGTVSAVVLIAYPVVAILAFLRLWDLARAIARQDELRRTLVDRSADAIFLLGGDPPIVREANEAAGSLLGRARGDLIGMPISALVAPDELPRQRERVASMRREGTPVLVELAMVRADGSSVDVEINEQAVAGGRIVGVARDIGARKRAEAERARLLSALEQTADMLVITDVDGRILFANCAFARALAMTRDELVGRHPADLAGMLDIGSSEPGIMAALGAGRPWTGSMTIHLPGAPQIEVELAISLVVDQDGSAIGAVGLGRDVTRQRLLEAQLRQAQKMEAVGQLAGGMAHDFNNLLTAIRGYAEMIRDAAVAGEPASPDDVDQVMKAADRASLLTGQMLQFARRQRLRPRAVDARTVIDGIAPLLQSLVREQVRVVISGTSGTVMADPTALEQVLVNLAVNARDAMPGGGALTVDVGTLEVADGSSDLPAEVKPGPYVRISVSDTGTGMDAAVRTRAFEPFFTTKEPGHGTGMGLATVYGIVKQSDGYVYIGSEPGQGTRVDVYLPRIMDTAAACEGATGPRPGPRGGDETILLVEDEQAVREFARRVLEGRGYRVLEATNGVDALRVADACATPIDLVVTDVVMPEMGGHDLAQRIRVESPDLRILFVSGFMDRGSVPAGGPIGDRPLLVKPFSGDALAGAVRAILDAATGDPVSVNPARGPG